MLAELTLALLVLSLPVSAASGLEMSTSYPGIKGSAGENLSFDLHLFNDSGGSRTAELSVADIPDGWSGSFIAGGSKVRKVHTRLTSRIQD